MMRFKKLLLLGGLLALTALPALAQPGDSNSEPNGSDGIGPLDRLNNVAIGENGAFSEATDDNTLVTYLGYVLGVMFSLFGVIFVALIIFAGYNWMTAAGDKDKVNKATSIIKASILGIIVVVAAYAVWQFVFVRVVQGL